MKYRMYMLQYKDWRELEVFQKGFVNVRGHFVYNIWGKDEFGKKCVNNVAKDVWDRFDVPVVEYQTAKKETREKKEKYLNRTTKNWSNPIFKSDNRRINNEEIEKWLAEHNNLDLNNIKDEGE